MENGPLEDGIFDCYVSFSEMLFVNFFSVIENPSPKLYSDFFSGYIGAMYRLVIATHRNDNLHRCLFNSQRRALRVESWSFESCELEL